MEIIIILLVITILAIVGVGIIQKIKTARFNRKWEKERVAIDEKVATLKEKKKYVRYSA